MVATNTTASFAYGLLYYLKSLTYCPKDILPVHPAQSNQPNPQINGQRQSDFTICFCDRALYDKQY
jgi:hypothetical protein